MENSIKTIVQNIVQLLVNEEFQKIETLTAGIRLSANEIRTAIYEYGCTLILPPPSEYKTLDIIRIKDETASSWSVRMNLWTQEEGKSDLSIELTIKEEDGVSVVEFDDIHVS
ncbi:MAG: hypothetical protein JXB42_06635 [Deltaproteobacteria bacterium]|nr:hypothetical protein [Deltaproteobacteria bacterium]